MSTERIARLQSLLERIKRNAVLPKARIDLVFGGTRGTHSDVSTGPAVPAASFALSPADEVDEVTPAPMAPIRAIEIEAAPLAATQSRTPTLTGSTRIPTISGMVSPVVELEAAAKLAPTLDVIEELDIDDVDVVDITTEPPPAPVLSSVEMAHVVDIAQAPVHSAAPDVVQEDDLNWSEPPVEEKLPDSSPRPRAAAASLDEALADAAESESTAPLKTPPPESGRQPTEGVYAERIPEPSAADFMPLPRPEQLGETVELEEPTSAEIELDIPVIVASAPKEELEFELPARESSLEPPTSDAGPTDTREAAQPESLARSRVIRVPEESDTVETPVVVLPQESPAPSTDRDSLPPVAELTARKTEGKEVTPEYSFATRKFVPNSFAELLDASLSLVPKS